MKRPLDSTSEASHPSILDAATKRRIEDYVRPLAIGLGGVTNYGEVERVRHAAEAIARGRPEVDPDLLHLLAVFSGQEKWVSQIDHRSRTEIFLLSSGVSEATVRSL